MLAYTFRMVASFTPRSDLGRELSALRRPLLVLTGDRDESFHADQYGPPSPRMPPGTVRTLPGVTHLGLVVNRRTAEEIEAWLDRLP